MAIKIFGLRILTKGQLAELKSFGLSELDKAIVAAKQTQLGATVAAVVKTVEDPSLTGAQKMEKALVSVVPAVIDYAARGGLAAVAADAETFARQLIESTLADTKQTKLVQVALAVLKALGVSL